MMESCTFAEIGEVPSMDGAQPLGMYIVSSVLFLIPCSLLWVAWRRSTKGSQESELHTWRRYCVNAALLVAGAATLTTIAFVFSWLLSGGSPHGMDPSPGLWKSLGPIIKWTLVTSVVFAVLGKGKGRFLVLAWAVADVFVVVMVNMLQMD
jgi:hypothetical protein